MFQILRKVFFSIAILLLVNISAQSQVITGRITNTKSQPIANAFIHLLNTNTGTLTDAQGNYSFKHITSGKYIVFVSAVGYADVNEEVFVSATGAELNIQLTDALVRLDEVVVTAQKKEESLQNIPLSITAISSKQVQEYQDCILWTNNLFT